MATNPSAPADVKEFEFYPESNIVIVIYGNDETIELTGKANYKAAHHAAVKAHTFSEPTPALELTDDDGKTLTFNVPVGTPHETFDA